MPQLASATLAGTLTQTTFTLEQPRGQFSHLNISDLDAIWLVVARSNGGCCGAQALVFPLWNGREAREEPQVWGEGRQVCRGCGRRAVGPGGRGGALPPQPPPFDLRLPSATQSFTAPQRAEDIPAPADFTRRGYYLTLMARRSLYPGNQPGNQLRVLRVGNDTGCLPARRGCNAPLPGPGPYR